VRAAVIAAALVLASAAPARATPADDFDHARQLFVQRDWQSAIPLLGSVLYPQPLLGDSNKVFEAHVILGACEFETGDKPTAHDEFEKALDIDPDRQLSGLSFSEGAIELYEATKTQVHKRNAEEATRLQRAESNQRVQDFLNNIVLVESHSYTLNFVPFGVGQFQNGQRRKGLALAIGEGATFSTSVVIFGYLVNKYGISGTVSNIQDAQTVRRLQQVEIGTGAAFYGLWFYGIVDALLHYKSATEIQTDPSLLPPDLRSIDPKAPAPTSKPPASPKTSFHVEPMLVPSGAGLGLSWER
jgi:tetratricopeptide (TPR) repeat protein